MIKVKNFSEEFYTSFHKWEVIMHLDDGRHVIEKFEKNNPEGFEQPEDQYNAMIQVVNGCRLSDTEYSVFMDDDLTDL